MLTRILHKIVALPLVYDAVQRFFGRAEGHRQMRTFFEATAGCLVPEVGAGTGDKREKLGGLRSKKISPLAVVADDNFLRQLANVCRKKLIFLNGYRYDPSLVSLAAIQKWFEIDRKAEFAIYHRYLVCTPKR